MAVLHDLIQCSCCILVTAEVLQHNWLHKCRQRTAATTTAIAASGLAIPPLLAAPAQGTAIPWNSAPVEQVRLLGVWVEGLL